MTKRFWLVPALLLISSALPGRPQFEEDQVTVDAQSWQYTQVLTYNYTSGNSSITDVDNGERTASRDIQEEGYIGFFLYDYTVARYTEELTAGHKEL